MRISFVTRHIDRAGHVSGVMAWLNQLVLGLEQHGAEVSIVTSATPAPNDDNRHIHAFQPWNLRAFRRRVAEARPDQVVFVSSTSRPTVLFWWWMALALSIPKTQRVFYQTTNFLRPPGAVLQFLLRRCFDHVLAANQRLSHELGDAPETPVAVLHPAIRLPEPRRLSGTLDRKRVVGFMGHYSRIKGADRFVALSERPDLADYQFIIAGGPTYARKQTLFEEAQQQSARQHNLTTLGYVSKPLDILAGFDLLVLPYRSGATVLAVAQTAIEAMALGIPVLGTHNAALDDLIIDGYNGFYCESLDEFERAIIAILSDTALYQRLSANARQTATEHFSVAHRITEFMDITDA